MTLQTDSLINLQHQIDSLNKVIIQNKIKAGWFKIDEAPVQAASIVAVATIITVILGFVFKDFWIPHWVENRTKKKEATKIFSQYKTHLFWAALSFNHRIYEIYHTRSHFLWRTESPNTFYDYKYKSSVFRLCILFAWVRAYKLAQSNMIIERHAKNAHNLNNCIFAMESAFADGQRVEIYMARAVLEILGVDVQQLRSELIEKFSVELDHFLHESLEVSQKEYLTDVSEKIQDQFLVDIGQSLEKLKIKTYELAPLKAIIIKQVSIKLALIYRDWQQAIGDLMLVKEEGHYTTISFRTFEEYWHQELASSEKKWLKRAEVMFNNLNLSIDSKTDSRVEQLEIIYNSVYQLVNKLYSIHAGQTPMNIAEFQKIKPTIK